VQRNSLDAGPVIRKCRRVVRDDAPDFAEDRPIVENVFRATASPDAVQGPLSYLERNLWDFCRYLARRL
jgi:hypothetical protein